MIEINQAQFGDFISNKEVSVVDFYAPWCGPCKILAPRLSVWAEKYKVPAAKMDITNNMDVTSQYQVNLLPTVIVFKNGKEHKRLIGVFDENEFKKSIE